MGREWWASRMDLPVMPPVKPMLAKPVKTIPPGMLYEPKWDGFRSIIFRDGDQVEIGSRNEKPMTRYFPEVVEAVRANFPEQAVIDGEIILVDRDARALDFELLQQRIHPAASRVKMLSQTTPAGFVAFDLLALGDDDLMRTPLAERRRLLTEALGHARPPVWVTPATTDQALAQQWFVDFEGAGLDGVIAKPLDLTYQPDKRVMSKIKHARTADCVVAGYRTHKGDDHAIGSLLLGIHADDGNLSNVGVIGAFPAATRRSLFEELQPLVTDFDGHPWNWAEMMARQATDRAADGSQARNPRASEYSRWNNGKDLSFTPLRPELVVEVRYDYMEGRRFRHTAQFNRWRPDRDPASCTFDQLEVPVSFDLGEVLPGSI